MKYRITNSGIHQIKVGSGFEIYFDKIEVREALQTHIHLFFRDHSLPMAILKGEEAAELKRLMAEHQAPRH